MSEDRNVQPSRDPVIPDKLYFRIGEVARLLDVETHTLRFWETEFPQLKIGKGGTGQRLYRRRDVELVLEIKHLLYEQGYTIPGARQFLQARHRRKEPASPKQPASAPSPAPAAVEPREGGLHRIRAELRDLSAMLNDPPANGVGSGSTAQTPPRLARATPRRGLHLAERSAKPREPGFPGKPGTSGRLPGLFDPESE